MVDPAKSDPLFTHADLTFPIITNTFCADRAYELSPRYNVSRLPVSTLPGVEMPWKDKIRHLGSFAVQSEHLNV